jgi:hypothetical protein
MANWTPEGFLGDPGRIAVDIVEDGAAQAHRAQQLGERVGAHRILSSRCRVPGIFMLGVAGVKRKQQMLDGRASFDDARTIVNGRRAQRMVSVGCTRVAAAIINMERPWKR